jgi:uncharacterized membrane protein
MLDRRLQITSLVLAVLGLADAGYLTYTHYAENGVCGVSSGCTVVQQSTWSELFGIPVSLLGVIGYVGLLTLLVLLSFRLDNETVRLLLVMGTGIGFLFSMFLMYRAYITLEAFCPFCTTSAVVMTLLAIISTTRFIRGPGLAPGAFSEPLVQDD